MPSFSALSSSWSSMRWPGNLGTQVSPGSSRTVSGIPGGSSSRYSWLHHPKSVTHSLSLQSSVLLGETQSVSSVPWEGISRVWFDQIILGLSPGISVSPILAIVFIERAVLSLSFCFRLMLMERFVDVLVVLFHGLGVEFMAKCCLGSQLLWFSCSSSK